MRSCFFTSIIVAVLFADCSSSSKTATGSVTEKKEIAPQLFLKNISADGIADDWGTAISQYDKDSKTFYAVANDEQSLHFIMRITEPTQQMKILQAGMDVYIDLGGKKSKLVGIKYPLKSEATTEPSAMGGRNGTTPDRNKMVLKIINEKNQLELTGFKNNLNGKQELINATVIKPTIGFEEGNIMIYELTIPFTAFAMPVSYGSTVNIGVFFNGIEMPAMGNGSMPSGGSPGGGMRPSGGGMPGGGMSRGGSAPDMSQMTRTTSFWYKFILASK